MSSAIPTALRAMARAQRANADALDAAADALEQGATDYVDPKEAAAIAKCSPRSIRKAIRGGRLEARGEGRHVLIARRDLEAWIDRMPVRSSKDENDESEDEIAAEVERRMGASQ